jgi:hypothetical protein
MKRNTIALSICGGVLVFIAVGLAFTIHDAKVMARLDLAEHVIHQLAGLIEIHRNNHKEYPSTLSDLNSKADADMRTLASNLVERIEAYQLSLAYQPGTNEFELTVTGIDSWRPKNDKVVRTYKIGEALIGATTRVKSWLQTNSNER